MLAAACAYCSTIAAFPFFDVLAKSGELSASYSLCSSAGSGVGVLIWLFLFFTDLIELLLLAYRFFERERLLLADLSLPGLDRVGLLCFFDGSECVTFLPLLERSPPEGLLPGFYIACRPDAVSLKSTPSWILSLPLFCITYCSWTLLAGLRCRFCALIALFRRSKVEWGDFEK